MPSCFSPRLLETQASRKQRLNFFSVWSLRFLMHRGHLNIYASWIIGKTLVGVLGQYNQQHLLRENPWQLVSHTTIPPDVHFVLRLFNSLWSVTRCPKPWIIDHIKSDQGPTLPSARNLHARPAGTHAEKKEIYHIRKLLSIMLLRIRPCRPCPA